MGKADAVLAVLRVSSDNDILHALSVILGERPPLMEHIASLIEQGQAQGERVVGVIKSFDAAKGFGFIQCDDTLLCTSEMSSLVISSLDRSWWELWYHLT